MTHLLITIGLFALGWWIGSSREQAHLYSLREREKALKGVSLSTSRRPPKDRKIESSDLMKANVVISWDYFKAIVSAVHMMLGGRISSLETLVERGRREAMVRLKEQANADGFDGVIGLRLETSRLTNSSGNNGLGGVEVLAYGTAVRLR